MTIKDELFYSLPETLQDKIIPPRKLSRKEMIENARRNASVTPSKYRNVKSLDKACGVEGGTTRGSTGDAETTPRTNRGVKISESDKLSLKNQGFSEKLVISFDAREYIKIVPTGKKGGFELVSMPIREKAVNDRHSFIDWINFVLPVEFIIPIPETGNFCPVSDLDVAHVISYHLTEIFGFGISVQRPTGLNFYKNSFDIGFGGWGFFCIGGMNDNCMITITGQGLLSARPGWEVRLYAFMVAVKDSKITRVDLATDNFDSAVSVTDYYLMFKKGCFNNKNGKSPICRKAGDWDNVNTKGITLYLGSRESGKYLRIYEKGLQISKGLTDFFPNWVRTELEFGNKGRVIPLDVLLHPGQYLAGAYPALKNINRIQQVIKTRKNIVKSDLNKSLAVTRNQFGRYIHMFSELYGCEEAVRLLTLNKTDFPERFKCHDFSTVDQTYLHNAASVSELSTRQHFFIKQVEF